MIWSYNALNNVQIICDVDLFALVDNILLNFLSKSLFLSHFLLLSLSYRLSNIKFGKISSRVAFQLYINWVLHPSSMFDMQVHTSSTSAIAEYIHTSHI